MRLGILRNAVSTGNRGRKALDPPPNAEIVETFAAADCRPALDSLHAAGVDALVIDGGDGTVRAAVTHLAAVFGDTPPPVAILANGNTNLVARRLGALGGASGLARLARMSPAELAARGRRTPMLRIAFADGRPPERGFIAGWGIYAEATRIAIEETSARHRAQVVRVALTALRRALLGRAAARLRQGIDCDFRAEGHATTAGRRFLGIATTLPGPLIWPLEPFWGGGSGAIRWLDVAAPPRRLVLAAPLVAVGRPMRWLGRAGYRSGRSDRLDLSLRGEIVVDGERIPCDGGVAVTADETVRFIRG